MNDIHPQPAEENSEPDWMAALSTTDRYRVLSSERRRVLLDILPAQSSSMTLDSLTKAVATQQCETTDPSAETIDEIMLTLHHNHLPMLSSLGVITYDPSAQLVSRPRK